MKAQTKLRVRQATSVFMLCLSASLFALAVLLMLEYSGVVGDLSFTRVNSIYNIGYGVAMSLAVFRGEMQGTLGVMEPEIWKSLKVRRVAWVIFLCVGLLVPIITALAILEYAGVATGLFHTDEIDVFKIVALTIFSLLILGAAVRDHLVIRKLKRQLPEPKNAG